MPKAKKPRQINVDSLRKIRARFWKKMARAIENGLTPNTFSNPNPEDARLPGVRNQFIISAEGPPEYLGFFEQDDRTGYLYVVARATKEVVAYVQIYTCAARLKVRRSEVRVVWSSEGDKCGVIIRGQMRGIIDLPNDRRGGIRLLDPSTPGVSDFEWLHGFEDYDPVVLFQ